jgi:tetratricopeptide (TPR) repeat protein
MKPLSIVLLSALVSTAAAGATVVVLGPRTAAGSDLSIAPGPTEDLRELRAEIAAQAKLLGELSAALELRTPSAPPSAARVSATSVEDVVRSVLDEERRSSKVETKPAAPPLVGAAGALARILELRAGDAGYNEIEKLWGELRAAGVMDEVVAEFERYAELHPDDPEAQVMLGNAYIQRLQSASGSEAGAWAIKADGAYTAALELDDHNWEARFSKAVSLSFWPPIFGKQQDAIGEFETLLQQQATAVPEPGHANTYVYLGNLYQQQGNLEKARRIWADGLAAFPNDPTLLAKQ